MFDLYDLLISKLRAKHNSVLGILGLKIHCQRSMFFFFTIHFPLQHLKIKV
jgi:DNA-directed RNA polymerase subunit N (RpoN/RPB10)